MKRYAAHASLIALMGVVALHTKAASADPNSFLYAFIGADEITQGPLEPAALAQNSSGDAAAVHLGSADGDVVSGSIGDVTGDDPEIDFNPSSDGSSVIAPLSPSVAPVPESGTPTENSNHRPFLYTVKDGDTISSIAAQFSITINTIRQANGLQNTDTINPGDVLTVLPTTGVLHTIQRGQTISSIANKYDVDADEIIAYNGLSEEGVIVEGKRLIIPGGNITEPSQPVVKPQTPDETPSKPEPVIPAPSKSSGVANKGGWLWPTKPRAVSQPYRPGIHTGDDIPDGPYINPPVYAAKAGTIEFAGRVGGYGNFVIVNHGGGWVTRYGHLKSFAVKAGQKVAQGDALGIMGTTGRSTGVHLHFEILNNGRFINPLSQF